MVARLAATLHLDGVLFGATVLGASAFHTPLSQAALRVNNRRGIFDNLTDTADGLAEILHRNFRCVELETVGAVAIFTARHAHPD